MLHLGQAFGRFDHPPQTIIVKLVGGGASRASAEDRAHGDDVIFLRDILMDGVIGKARERKSAAREKNFNLIGRRESS